MTSPSASVKPLVQLSGVFPVMARPGLRGIARFAERLLALDEINRIHACSRDTINTADFFSVVLQEFGVRFDVRPEELVRIPATGPVVVISNHPFGGLDAIILCALLHGFRRDAKVLANHLLERLPQVAPVILPVDPFGGPGAARRNVRGMQRALAHLEEGGLLGIFPSGAVSHFQWHRREVEDPAWSTHLFNLVRRSRATVVPVFFPGRNSLLFQIAGMIHPLLRTAMIPREAVRRRGDTIQLRIGKPISFSRLEKFEEPKRFTQFLRVQTYVLGGVRSVPQAERMAVAEPLAAAEDPERLVAEIGALPGEARIVRDGAMEVVLLPDGRDSALMREVGRLREETFRAAGEGTGRARDIDEFDSHYAQLILWDATERRVAGGYRLGRVDHILQRRGRAGLYTATLFRFKPGFFGKLGPAMELGRSWIRAEYQRKQNALAMLWRGIATLVVRQPECCVLLGPVSISRDYQPLSRGLIVSFLRHTRRDSRLARLVRPSRPFRLKGRAAQLARDAGKAAHSIDDVSLLISEIEADGKGVPLLFRHYLRLHSLVLSFNVDPAFADVVDGLLLTDLRRTDPHLLKRFMGVEGYAKFAAHHGLLPGEPQREPVAVE